MTESGEACAALTINPAYLHGRRWGGRRWAEGGESCCQFCPQSPSPPPPSPSPPPPSRPRRRRPRHRRPRRHRQARRRRARRRRARSRPHHTTALAQLAAAGQAQCSIRMIVRLHVHVHVACCSNTERTRAASSVSTRAVAPTRMVRAAQASPDHGFCGFRAERTGDPSCLGLS